MAITLSEYEENKKKTTARLQELLNSSAGNTINKTYNVKTEKVQYSPEAQARFDARQKELEQNAKTSLENIFTAAQKAKQTVEKVASAPIFNPIQQNAIDQFAAQKGITPSGAYTIPAQPINPIDYARAQTKFDNEKKEAALGVDLPDLSVITTNQGNVQIVPPKQQTTSVAEKYGLKEVGSDPFLYTAMQFGAGVASPMQSMKSGVSTMVSDLFNGGKTSDDFKKIEDYFTANPNAENLGRTSLEIINSKPGAMDLAIANQIGVSPQSLALYRESKQPETVKTFIDEAVGATTPEWYKSTLGNTVYSIGAQIVPMMYTMGASGASNSFLEVLSGGGKVSSALKALLRPSATTGIMAASSAGNKYNELAKEYGSNPLNVVNAIATGYGEALTENLGGFTDAKSFTKLFSGEGAFKNFIKYLSSGVQEGLEEVANVPLEGVIDKATVDPNKAIVGTGGVFDLERMIDAGVQGFMVGALMGGPAFLASTVSTARETGKIKEGVQTVTAIAKTSLPEDLRPAPIDPKTATMEDLQAYSNEVKATIDAYREQVITEAEKQQSQGTANTRPVTLPDGRTVLVDENNKLVTPENGAQTASPEAQEVAPAETENAPVASTEAGRTVISQDEVDAYIDYSFEYAEDPTLPKQEDHKKIAIPSDRLIRDMRPYLDLSEYSHALRDNDLRHIRNSHGEKTPEKYPVTADDLKKIPDIVKNYDDVLFVPRGKSKGIYYVKRHNGVTYYLEQATDKYNGEKLLINKQMIKVPTGTIPDIAELKNAINKKWNLDSYPDNAAKAVPRVYVQDVKNQVPTPIIPTFSENNNPSQKKVLMPGLMVTEEQGRDVVWSPAEKDGVSNAARSFEDRWGIKTRVMKPNAKTNAGAFLQNGVVVLNADKVNTYSGAVAKIVHEAAHIVENSKHWGAMKEAALEYYRLVNPDLTQNQLREIARARYNGVTELNDKGADGEIVAGFLESICGENQYIADRAVQLLLEKPNLFNRIRNFFADKVRYLKAKKNLTENEKHELAAARRALNNLYRGMKAGKKSGFVTLENGVKYSADQSFAEQVEKISASKSSKEYETSHVYLGETPKVLVDLGLDQLPMLITSRHLYTTINNAGFYKNVNYHGLGKELMKQIPQALKDPVMIMFSKTRPNDSIVMILNLVDSQQRPVLVTVKFNGSGNYNNVEVKSNVATSVYGKDEFNSFVQSVCDKKLVLYFNKQKSQKLKQTPGVQFPDNLSTTDFSSNIARLKELVKRARTNTSIPASSQKNTKLSYGEDSFTDYALKYLAKKYGEMPKGEMPSRDVVIPLKTSEKLNVRRGARTIIEAGSVSDEMAERLKEEVAKEALSYQTISDKSAEKYADEMIESRGIGGALDRWDAVVNGDERPTKNTLVLGEKLMLEAGKAGDVDTFLKLAAEVSAEATRASQTVQAMHLIKRMTPEGRLYYVEKAISAKQKDLNKKYGKKATQLNLPKELGENLLKAETQDQIDAAEEAILAEVAKQMPSTWRDKWDAWRYMAMLFNPRTHIRNVLGNAVFVPTRSLKNAAAYLLDKTVTQENRTVAFLTKKDKALRNFAENNFKEVSDVLTSGGKMNPSTRLDDLRKIFTSKVFAWLERLRIFNNKLLEKEDLFFLRRAYVNSFAQAMKARGLTAEFLSSDSVEARTALNRVQQLATKEALEATYRDASEFAKTLNRFKEGKVGYLVGNALFPFTKTPVNILKRGVEYSPVSIVKGIVDVTYSVRKGKKTAAEAINDWSKGLTGLGVVAFGYLLSHLGILVAGGPEDPDERGFETLQGAKTYSLKIGDVYYTIDWIAPTSLPLFVGAEMHKTFTDDREISFKSVMDSMSRISEPMFNLSMLDGLNDAIQSIAYTEDGRYLENFAVTAVVDYITQGLPTLGGQIARTIDPKARNSYYIDKNSWAPEAVQEFLNTAQAKLPGLSFLLSPSVDAWGRETGEENAVLRAFTNFISPGYYSVRNETPVDKEIAKVYEATGEKSVLPEKPGKTITVDGEKRNLTAAQYTKFTQENGQRAYRYVNQLMSSDFYDFLSPDEKAEQISKMYTLAAAEARKEVMPDYEIPQTVVNLYKASEKGVLFGFLEAKENADKDGNGYLNNDETRTYLDKLNIPRDKKALIFSLTNPNVKNNPYK